MSPPEVQPSFPPSPCGLYVHIPFCETKCGYCDFFSVALKGRETGPLVDRVTRELRTRLGGGSLVVSTVFCGGGTPTLLPVEELGNLLRAIGSVVAVDGLVEFTVEANPATVDDKKAALLVRHGVTRVSMGAQSFLPTELATLERIHSPEDIAPSVETLRRNGVRQVNLDLIFGIPGQTLGTWAESLRRAIRLGPDHIACYGLTYEPATRLTAQFRVGRITPCDEKPEAEMYLQAVDTLAEAGYEQYETSNFARPGCQCQHNLIYWRNEPYIGVGPSAAGCVDGRRYKNVADVGGYIRAIDTQGHAETESETIDREMLATEMILMQLRLLEGLSIEAFRGRVGIDPATAFGEALGQMVELGFVVITATHIALTREGRLVSDAVMRELASAMCIGSEKATNCS